jgi:hypothetical protein
MSAATSGLAEQVRAVTLADADRGPRPTARLGRYAIWQLRDYAFGAGGAVLVVSGLAVTMLTLSSIGSNRGLAAAANGPGVLLGMLGFLAPIFSCAGLVAEDRSKGFYRFNLAKPVSPVRLYGQAFLLRGVALLGITTLVWLACALLMATGSFFGALAYVVVCYLTIGGVTFLLSTMTRHAWIVTLLLGVGSAMASSASRVRGAWGVFASVVKAVLPPFHLVGPLGTSLLSNGYVGHLISAAEIVWFVGYGLLAVGAALAVIRGREWPL